MVSTTDPESGVFHKGEHKKCFAYEAHTACDKHNFVVGVHVTPGNIHDSVAFDPLYDEVCQYYPEHKTVVADSAYKTPWICSFHLLYPPQDQRKRPPLVGLCV